MKLTIFVLAHLTPLFRPWLPMGNRSSSFLVANGINVAGLLLVVAGRGPCFGSQINTALNKSLVMAGVLGLPSHALRHSVPSIRGPSLFSEMLPQL